MDKQYRLLNVGEKMHCDDEEYSHSGWKMVGLMTVSHVTFNMIPIRRLMVEGGSTERLTAGEAIAKGSVGVSGGKSFESFAVGAQALKGDKEEQLLMLRIEMTLSLQEAVKAAGGYWDVREYLSMSAVGLITRLAQNGIRFTYDKEKAFKS